MCRRTKATVPYRTVNPPKKCTQDFCCSLSLLCSYKKMASSRWKRFAFFDRNNVTLPSFIIDDLSTSNTTTTISNNGRTTQNDVYMTMEPTVIVEDDSNTNENNVASRGGSSIGEEEKYMENHRNDNLLTFGSSNHEKEEVNNVNFCMYLSSIHSHKIHVVMNSGTYRGWYNPFPPETFDNSTTNTDNASNMNNNDNNNNPTARVAGIASCLQTDDNICLAVITDTQYSVGVTMTINPHSSLQQPQQQQQQQQQQGEQEISSRNNNNNIYRPSASWDFNKFGKPKTVDIIPNLVSVGTDKGHVLLYSFSLSSSNKVLQLYMHIPPSSLLLSFDPQNNNTHHQQQHSSEEDVAYFPVTSLKLSTSSSSSTTATSQDLSRVSKKSSSQEVFLFCTFGGLIPNKNKKNKKNHGIVCLLLQDGKIQKLEVLDHRPVTDGNITSSTESLFLVARSDGLYTYSSTDRISLNPMDGSNKILICALSKSTNNKTNTTSAAFVDDPLNSSSLNMMNNSTNIGGNYYALVATTDPKSKRDAVDIYDATNKLVAFHVLLSPGHLALRACSICLQLSKEQRTCAVVWTSGGSLVLLTEKSTSEKVALLKQKNLYSAAIAVMAHQPAMYRSEIATLYQQHAQHLYRKGEYAAAMDQYIYTIGTLEPSHVIFRYLDAPKLPLLVKYLQHILDKNPPEDESRTKVQELLRTCYLKLNHVQAAEQLSNNSSSSISSNNLVVVPDPNHPSDVLMTICTLEATEAAEALIQHGALLARALPRETAGLVVSLADGTYSPQTLTDIANNDKKKNNQFQLPVLSEDDSHHHDSSIEKKKMKYPLDLFTNSFLENPKLLRLILSNLYKKKCVLSPSLKRTLLELTLEEWNMAYRNGDASSTIELCRKREALDLLNNDNGDIGNDEALLICELANFQDGLILLYERLPTLSPQLILEHYAQDGSYRARRNMLAMCRSDPELLPEVLGYFVNMSASVLLKSNANGDAMSIIDDYSDASEYTTEAGEIHDDIREALNMARAQGVIPPVRIAKILAGEGVGEFSSSVEGSVSTEGGGVPLSVGLEYIGSMLDDSSKEISRLKNDVAEYNQMCISMQAEIDALTRVGGTEDDEPKSASSSIRVQGLSISELYDKMLNAPTTTSDEGEVRNESEEFWREMEQSEDRFETVARFFGKDIIP